MKIEKVNDHQIRCTLTKADLADRELKISELAYGTEKAKNLFRDMMQQASLKFGFEAEDIPLMIEAIPLNSDCIVLIITKVEDPEELDTRFSKFAPSVGEAEMDELDPDDYAERDNSPADSIFDLFRQIQESRRAELANKGKATVPTAPKDEKAQAPSDNVAKPAGKSVCIFSFPTMHTLIRLAHVVHGFYDGKNAIYQNSADHSFLLVLSEEGNSAEDFNRICNVVSEYGHLERSASGNKAYCQEHCEAIIEEEALQQLASL